MKKGIIDLYAYGLDYKGWYIITNTKLKEGYGMDQLSVSLNQEINKLKDYLEDTLHRELNNKHKRTSIFDFDQIYIQDLLHKSNMLNRENSAQMLKLEREFRNLLYIREKNEFSSDLELLRTALNSLVTIRKYVINKEHNTNEFLSIINRYYRT